MADTSAEVGDGLSMFPATPTTDRNDIKCSGASSFIQHEYSLLSMELTYYFSMLRVDFRLASLLATENFFWSAYVLSGGASGDAIFDLISDDRPR
jgi:hypothetical protein